MCIKKAVCIRKWNVYTEDWSQTPSSSENDTNLFWCPLCSFKKKNPVSVNTPHFLSSRFRWRSVWEQQEMEGKAFWGWSDVVLLGFSCFWSLYRDGMMSNPTHTALPRWHVNYLNLSQWCHMIAAATLLASHRSETHQKISCYRIDSWLSVTGEEARV